MEIIWNNCSMLLCDSDPWGSWTLSAWCHPGRKDSVGTPCQIWCWCQAESNFSSWTFTSFNGSTFRGSDLWTWRASMMATSMRWSPLGRHWNDPNGSQWIQMGHGISWNIMESDVHGRLQELQDDSRWPCGREIQRYSDVLTSSKPFRAFSCYRSVFRVRVSLRMLYFDQRQLCEVWAGPDRKHRFATHAEDV